MQTFGLFLAFSLCVSGTNAQSNISIKADSSIVEQTQCVFPAYEAQSAGFKRVYTEQEFNAAKQNSDVDCLRIKYLSDGLKVVGFIVKPKKVEAKKLPIIVVNRGGFGEFGKIDMVYLLDFYRLAAEGFLVVASQYRGVDSGEGKDEIGGADVGGVLNLASIARSLDYADPNNVFLYGMSRGGMMSFLALKRGMTVNAVAVLGALYDAEAITKRNPLLLQAVKQYIPDYASKGVEALKERSVLNWTEKINVPVLILHGGADDSVPAAEALTFAQKLQEAGKTYELIIYAKDTHPIFNNREDRNKRIALWFKKHTK